MKTNQRKGMRKKIGIKHVKQKKIKSQQRQKRIASAKSFKKQNCKAAPTKAPVDTKFSNNLIEDYNELEGKYERNFIQTSEEYDKTNVRMLLPIKAKDGFIRKHLIEKMDDTEMDVDTEEETEVQESEEPAEPKLVSTAQLLAYRESKHQSFCYRIGVLSSEILENPQERISNIAKLLKFVDERNAKIYLTVRKLATASLFEIFKDILPSYKILLLNTAEVKLKKETLHLQQYEAALLKYYKQYLQMLEKTARVLIRRRQGLTLKEQDLQLAIFAVRCMCNLLTVHPYTNFSSNIAHFLVPLLDNRLPAIRKIVHDCFVEVFKSDKVLELSLTIVRRLNQYIKLHKNQVHVEVASVLLGLRIKDFNPDKEQEEQRTHKKDISHKERALAMSKKERRRKSKLKRIEQDLLETKAVENKGGKQKILAEILSLLFTIYFRILKEAPKNQVLTSCLKGLLKFSESISINYYEDLVNVLDKMLDEQNLSLQDRIYCLHVIFVISSSQVSMLNIDPSRFYTHLYKLLLNIHVGATQTELDILIKTLVEIFVHRCRDITTNRLLAFTKRLATVSLNLQHNACLSIVNIIRLILQSKRITNGLLNSDGQIGNNIYLPELEDPEFCNASSTSLWEIIALQRHYHSAVQNIAKLLTSDKFVGGDLHISTEILKLSSIDMFNEWDPSKGLFKPSIPLPKTISNKNKRKSFVK